MASSRPSPPNGKPGASVARHFRLAAVGQVPLAGRVGRNLRPDCQCSAAALFPALSSFAPGPSTAGWRSGSATGSYPGSRRFKSDPCYFFGGPGRGVRPEAVPPAALRRRCAVRLPRPPPFQLSPSQCLVTRLLHDCHPPGGPALRGPCDLQARSVSHTNPGRSPGRHPGIWPKFLLLGVPSPVKGAGLFFPAMWRLA